MLNSAGKNFLNKELDNNMKIQTYKWTVLICNAEASGCRMSKRSGVMNAGNPFLVNNSKHGVFKCSSPRTKVPTLAPELTELTANFIFTPKESIARATTPLLPRQSGGMMHATLRSKL
jgi:hypothetical protein